MTSEEEVKTLKKQCEQLETALRESRLTNAALHRRAQKAEGPVSRKRNQQIAVIQRLRDALAVKTEQCRKLEQALEDAGVEFDPFAD